MRACYAYQIPMLLLKTEVFDKKSIDPANYSITYRYAVIVPREGYAYGDCGVTIFYDNLPPKDLTVENQKMVAEHESLLCISNSNAIVKDR
nr:phospholipase-like protein [Tanacetum cinerariifolium]